MEDAHILITKFIIPPLRMHLLPRVALIERLNQNRTLPLTLLSAGAGFGKTTLLAAWANQNARTVAWLTLDSLDNDPLHFWREIIAALRTSLPTVGEGVLALLRSPQPPRLSALLTVLINELATLDAETMLILDDYHVIEEQSIHESLAFLLDHAPGSLHLAIASRVDPPLPLSRWRVRGQLAEIRDAELRLDEEETASFLREVMGVQLRKEEVTRLAKRTSGWIAGLQLAALSLRGYADPAAFVKAFSGSQRLILDYVQEEILESQPRAIQRFLMQTAILDRMNAALCQTVTGEQSSQALLETLERSHLFLVPLDEERCWYRLHDLFREAMLARLHTMQPEMVSVLHQRAAQWYEARSQWREAISHRLAAADFSYAARLMEQTARHFWLCGEAATMSRWVMELPHAVICEHAQLVLTSALYLLNANYFFNAITQRVGAYKEAEKLMKRVEIALRQQGEDAQSSNSTEIRLLKQRLRLLRVWSRALEPLMSGDNEEFHLIYQQMQNLERDDEVAWQMIPLYITFMFHYLCQQEGALLIPQLQDTWQRVSQAEDHFAMIEVRRWLTLASLCTGRLHLVHQECLASLALLEQIEGYAILAGDHYMGLAHVLYQWNQLEEARNILQRVIHDATYWEHIYHLAWGYRSLMQVELAEGDLLAAQQALQEAERLAQQTKSVFHQSWIMGFRVQWWLAMGYLAEANEWAAHVTLRQDIWEPHRANEVLALVHISLAQQHYSQAVEMLERWQTHLDRPGNNLITISFLSLYMVALQQAGKRGQARATAARLFALTEPEGYLRLYLDIGQPMKQTLQSLLTTSQDNTERLPALSRTYILRLLSAFEQEEQLRRVRADVAPGDKHVVSPPFPQHCSGSTSVAPAWFKPLTLQEQRVLRLLAEGASNQQIATQLVIQLVTVKKHVTNLLSKLGAVNRTQALVRAREYDLL